MKRTCFEEEEFLTEDEINYGVEDNDFYQLE